MRLKIKKIMYVFELIIIYNKNLKVTKTYNFKFYIMFFKQTKTKIFENSSILLILFLLINHFLFLIRNF
jgi:hypothetical protein